MSYDAQKVKMGREPVQILEIDLDVCSLAYGVSPCTASGPAAQKCFNTRRTCQDIPNYAKTTKTFRFSNTRVDGLGGADDAPVFPTIGSVRTSPTRLSPGKGLGVRETCKVTVADLPWSDVGVDPYRRERDYDPVEQGSFWGKLIYRHEFYEGRPMRILTGYLDDDGSYNAANMKTREYIINRISGPDPTGKVVVEGKDVLKLADGIRRQWPLASRATLTGDITSSQTSIIIEDTGGIFASHWSASPQQPWIRIGDEVMEVTAASNTAGDSWTLTVTRATLPSIYTLSPTAEEHDDESTVQPCWYFDAIRIDDLVYFLLNTGAQINSSFLPASEWEAVIDFGLQSYLFSALIIEPEGIKTLLDEITEHTILLWWDTRAQVIKMDSIINRKLDAGPFTDDDNIIDGSVAVSKDVEGRISETWISHGLRSPLEDTDKLQSYQRTDIAIDSDKESALEYGDVRVKSLMSRWMPLSLAAVASEIGNRLLNSYKLTKTVMQMGMDPKDDDIWTGNRIYVKTRYVQDQFGANLLGGYRIIETNEQISKSGVKYKYTMLSESALLRIGLITPDKEPDAPGETPPPGAPDFPDYPDASDALKNHYAFIAPDSGFFSDETQAYQIV